MQSRAAVPGGHGRWGTATVLHAVPTLRPGGARAHDRRIHAHQPVRRMLRFDPLLSGQEFPATALGERQRIPVLPVRAPVRAYPRAMMDTMLDREQAWNILCEFTKSDGLRKHALAVETCVTAYARKLGEDEPKWSDLTRCSIGNRPGTFSANSRSPMDSANTRWRWRRA